MKRKTQNYNSGSINIEPRKKNQKESIQRTKNFHIRPRKKFNNNKTCRFCPDSANWSPTNKCPALDRTCNKCGTKGHFARTCRQGKNYKNKVRNVTEIENPTIGEEIDESESSIYRIEKINRIVDKNKYLIPTVKNNGMEIEFIVDTGSPISIMPADNKIMKETEIQKVKHRYQDVNNNELKSRGKIPVDTEYENNKQKMQLLSNSDKRNTDKKTFGYKKRFHSSDFMQVILSTLIGQLIKNYG